MQSRRMLRTMEYMKMAINYRFRICRGTSMIIFTARKQISVNDFIREKGKPRIDVYADLVEDMKYLVVKTFESIKKKLNSENRKFCFELFGFDFIIDQDFTVWLIEVNTNPCLDESSALLKGLLPRMLDDAFKLTIDRIFPNPKDAA